MPKRSSLITAEIQLNPAIPKDITDNFFDENGMVTDRAVKLFAKRKSQRSNIEHMLVRELTLLIWRGESQKNIARFAKILNMDRQKAEVLIKEALEPLSMLPEHRQMNADHENLLEQIRFESHASLVKLLLEAQQRFLIHALKNIDDMKASEAMQAHATALKNAELLSGRATSRSSRMDERSKSTEQLREEVEATQKKISKMNLKLVGGQE